MIKFITHLLLAIALLIAVLCLPSCRTVKYVDRYHTVTDSSVLEQNAMLQRTLHETIENYEKQLADSSGVTIVYQNNTDTVQLPGTVTIDRTGAIQAQGALKSVQVTNTRLQREKAYLQATIDSLRADSSSRKVQVVTETKHVTKYVKRGWPWWVWILIGAAGMWVWERRRKILSFLKRFI